MPTHHIDAALAPSPAPLDPLGSTEAFSPIPLGRLATIALYALFLACMLGYDLYLSLSGLLDDSLLATLCVTTAVLSAAGQVLSLYRNQALPFVSFLFCYLFMGIAPVAQIALRSDPVFVIGNYAVLAAINGLLFTALGLVLVKRSSPATQPDDSVHQDMAATNFPAIAWLTGIVEVAALAMVGSSVFTNREAFGSHLAQAVGDAPTGQLLFTVLLLLPFFGSAIGLRRAMRAGRPGWIVLFAILLIGACVLNNPMVNARFKVAGLAFFFLDFFFSGRKTTLLALALVAGIAIAPAMNMFRGEAATSELNLSGGLEGAFTDTFVSMDYDAFETSAYTALVVDRYGSMMGLNLLGSALFFVPRSVWPAKPPPSAWILAYFMMDYRMVGTANLSTPLMAEGYFGFGWLGAALIGWLYWKLVYRVTEVSAQYDERFVSLVRSVSVGLALIFLRGTLIVGMAALAGYLVSAYLPYRAANWRARNTADPADS